MQQQKQTLKKTKKLKNKSQYLQLIFCSFLNWRYSIDSKYNLKNFVLKKKIFGLQLSHFFSLLFLIFGYKIFKNKQKTNNFTSENFYLNSNNLPSIQRNRLNYRPKATEIFIFWQYLKTNINKKLEIFNQKTIFSYWFLPILGFISFQYMKSSFSKKNFFVNSRVNKFSSFKNILSLQGEKTFTPKYLNFDTEMDQSESFLAFSTYFSKKKKKQFQTNIPSLSSLALENRSSGTKFLKNQEQVILELEQKQLKILTKKFFKELGICSSLEKLNKFTNDSSKTEINNLTTNSLSYLNKNFFQTSSFFWNWYVLDSSRNYYKNAYETVDFLKEKNYLCPFPLTIAPLNFFEEKTLPIIYPSKFNNNKYVYPFSFKSNKNLYLFPFFSLRKNKAYLFFSSKKRNRQVLEKKQKITFPFFFEKKKCKGIENYFDLFSLFFPKEKSTNQNKKRKELESLCVNLKKNSFYSYEKACFLWEMYLKNFSFESQKKFYYSRKIFEDFRNIDKFISPNSLLNSLDSLNEFNILNKTRNFSKNFKNLDKNVQDVQINKEKKFFLKLKSNKQKANNSFWISLFLKNIINLQNVNFCSYVFINKKNGQKKILKKTTHVSMTLASLNLKNHLVKTFCYKLLKDKNSRSNSSYLIPQFESFLLKNLKTLKEQNTINPLLFFKKKKKIKGEFNVLSNMLFLKQLFFIQKSAKIVNFNEFLPQINTLEKVDQNRTNISKKKIINYRFPILMSGYPQKFEDLTGALPNKNKNIWLFFLKKKKTKLFLFKKQQLIKKINAKNKRSLKNFQIEIQTRLRENSPIIKQKEKKNNLGLFFSRSDNKKNKFVFYDHTFSFFQKRKNEYMFFDSLKKNIEQKAKKKHKIATFDNERKKEINQSFFKPFTKQPSKENRLYTLCFFPKKKENKKNSVVSYKSFKFVKSNFLISNFYLSQNLKLNSLKDTKKKQISFLNVLSETRSTKMFSSLTRFLLNFLNKSYYLINYNEGIFKKEKNYNVLGKGLDQGSQLEYEKNEHNQISSVFQIKDYFSFLSKLKEFSSLIKNFPLTIYYTNISEKVFLIFKRIKIFVYQKILKNFVFVSLTGVLPNKKLLNQQKLDSTEEFPKKRQFKLKRKTKLTGFFFEKKKEKSSLIVDVFNKRLIKNFKKKFLLSNLEKRKYEKLFRSYLSCKSEKSNLNLKKQTSKAGMDLFLKKRICDSIKNRISIFYFPCFFENKNFAIFQKKNKKINFLYPLPVKGRIARENYFFKSNNKFLFLKEETSNNVNFTYFKDKKIKKKNLKRLALRLSPNEFLKKKHFIFFTDSYKSFLSFFLTPKKREEKLRLEKIKNFQKKRRLKKQKKETRRRKRRKRFYPRPFWLRFKTYQKFLQTRHFKICIPIFFLKEKKIENKQQKFCLFFNEKKKKQNNSVALIDDVVDIYSFKKANGFKSHKDETYLSFGLKNQRQESLNNNFFSEMKITQDILRKKIYRRNKQKWGHCVYETPFTEKIFLKKSKFLWSLPLLNSRNFYQLSNNLKNDFQRMSWKSYWLRQNLNPYFQRVNSTLENLQRSSMQECLSKSLKSFLLNFLGFDVNFRETEKYSYLNGDFQNQNFLTLNKSPLSISKIPFKNSIKSKFFYTNSSEYSQAILFSEYQRILYNRMLESFKNIKQNLSGNGLFQPRFVRTGRKKFSSNERNKNFWQKFNDFVNLEVPISAIQPSGYSTKLRGLWALNKTNLLTFKERNMIQSLWSSVKLRDQKKSKKRSVLKKTFQDLKKVLFNLNLQDLESLYFVKIQNKEKKLDVLGSFLLKEKKQPETFQLKMELKKKNTFLLDKGKKEQIKEKFLYQPRFSSFFLRKKQKRFSNYWWNTEIQKKFFFFSSLFPSEKNEQEEKIGKTKSSFFLSDFPYSESPLFFVSLWISTLLIHLALIFFIFSIPEIRSLVKFQILIFYKICLSLTITIYYLYNGLKNWNLRFNFFTSKYQRFLKSNVKDKFHMSLKEQHSSSDNRTIKTFKSVSKLSLEQLNSTFIDKTLSTSNFYNVYSSSLLFFFLSEKKKEIKKKRNKKTKKKLMSLKSSLLFVKYNLIFPINIKVLNKKRKKIAKIFLIPSFSIKNKRFYSEYLKFLFSKVFYFLNTKSGFVGGSLGPLTLLTIGSLIIIKNVFQIFYKCFSFFYTIFIKIIDFFESILIIFYKFLEKPAEVLIEWMAQIFLIEWSSNRLVYVPETFDIQIWNSIYKTSRSLRIFNLLTTLLIRRVWCITETFFKYINKPDKELIYRQKKGIFFWDLWVDILLQIADKYNLNIPSLNTLKEEQEFFMERLLQDQDWDQYSTKLEKINPFYFSQDVFSANQLLFLKSKNFKIQKQLEQKTDQYNNNLFLFKNSNLKFLEESTEINQHRNIFLKNNSRWSFHQDWISQGRETDLFLDIHPPKSLAEISYLKFTPLSHQPITSFVCQIFSGIFSKQVAKNILLIGPPGLGKSLFIQAMAGETELQMITEHAHRYSLVSRGVAVGMKLLKHVFDSISFSTPCFFLIEDIHLIGEKRPISISDDQNVKALDVNTGYDQEEIHEKNQAIYQLSRHSLSHYKKPSKGDFSLLIPTNHFCFDLFLGVSVPRTRQYLRGPSHPLNIESIQNQLNKQTENQQNFSNSDKFQIDNVSEKLVTHLQLPSQKFFSPPPTSPFTLFALKEQQKFQPKKVIKQMPWSGLSWDQMMRMPKTTYSVKTKVAMLAEIARTHFTVKLEMITDLLVLIDNVRSVRGFVVFGTTHKPHVLDPALRRPGRFDETISFPYIPNLLTRWQILKTSVSQFSKTLDCLDYAVICKNLHENQLSDFLLRAKFFLSNDENYFKSFNQNSDFSQYMNLSNLPEINSQRNSHLSFSVAQLYMRKFFTNSIHSKINNLFFSSFLFFSERKKKIKSKKENKIGLNNELDLNKNSFSDLNSSFKFLLQNSPRNFLPFYKRKIVNNNLEVNKAESKSLLTILRRLTFYSFIPSGPSNVLAMTYFHVSKLLIHTKILKDPTSFGLILFSFKSFELSQNPMFTISKLLFSSSNDLSLEFLRLFAGKIGEFFVFSSTYFKKHKFVDPMKKNKNSQLLNQFPKGKYPRGHQFLLNSFNGAYSFYGIDENWRSVTSLAFSILQKRYFYSKNLVVSRLLCFDNFSSFKEVLSPPVSFCYIPGKRYENFKKVEKDFNQKLSFSLSEKIDLIQQQKLNKKLYKKSIQELFLFPKKIPNFLKEKTKGATEIGFNKRFYTNFNVSTRELIPIHLSTIRVTSSNSYYRKRILERHRFSFVNHWWNGHLSEHNVETTFLSDVDWRYSFRESLGDVVIDFPDTEQYYNPRSRRWMLSSGYWADWNSFEKIFNEEISYHYISESFNKAFTFLENYREILDHIAYKLLKNGFLKEIDLLDIFNRFCIFKK